MVNFGNMLKGCFDLRKEIALFMSTKHNIPHSWMI